MGLDKTISDILIPDPNRIDKFKKNKIGLFFGTFNPIHNGHMIIANYILEFSDLEQIFFVVSPQNPFKKKSGLLEDYHRLALVQEAIGDNGKYLASDIEFKMPKPSYTIDTLTYLQEKYPKKELAKRYKERWKIELDSQCKSIRPRIDRRPRATGTYPS